MKIKSIWIKLLAVLVVVTIAYNFNKFLAMILGVCFIAFEIYNSRAVVYSIIGNTKLSKGLKEESLSWYKKAHDTKNCSINLSIYYAYFLVKQGYVKESEEVMSSLESKQISKSEEVSIKCNKALILWKKDDLMAAIDILESIEKNYRNTVVFGSLGYFYILSNQYEKALEFNLEAYDYNSDDVVVIDNLAQLYYKLEKYEDSMEKTEELLRKNPTFPEAYYTYALLLVKKDENEEALTQFKKALEYKTSFLTVLTRGEIENEIKKIEGKLNLNG